MGGVCQASDTKLDAAVYALAIGCSLPKPLVGSVSR